MYDTLVAKGKTASVPASIISSVPLASLPSPALSAALVAFAPAVYASSAPAAACAATVIPATQNITPKQRNEVIIRFLNEVHNPLQSLQDRFKLPGTYEHNIYCWGLGDEGITRDLGQDVHAIHYRWPGLAAGLAILQNGLNMDQEMIEFDSRAMASGFTEDIINEFKNNLTKGLLNRRFQYCFAIVNQGLLDKLYIMAERYFKLIPAGWTSSLDVSHSSQSLPKVGTKL